MSDPSARTFRSDFKRFFLRGLVVVLPTVLTLWIVVKAYQFVNSAIAEPINSSLRAGMVQLTPHWQLLRIHFEPSDKEVREAKAAINSKDISDNAVRSRVRADKVLTWWRANWYMNVIGLVVAIVAVYIAGRLLGGFLGRRVYRGIERLITTVPVFKQVYPYVKQIVDFLFGDDKALKFSRVVIVQFPRVGVWSLGFQTGPAMPAIADKAGDSVSVFIPNSPTPFTGFAITVPRKDVIEVAVTVEEALRFIVSGGVLIPGGNGAVPSKPVLIPIAAESAAKLASAAQES